MKIIKTLLYNAGTLWEINSNKHSYIGDEGDLIRPIRTFLQLNYHHPSYFDFGLSPKIWKSIIAGILVFQTILNYIRISFKAQKGIVYWVSDNNIYST